MSTNPQREMRKEIMWRLTFKLLKLLWNALPLVLIALVGWYIYSMVSGGASFPFFPKQEPGGDVTIVNSGTVLEAIKSVNKQIFIEHYNAVDVSYSEAPSDWAEMLGIKQEFVALIRGRVPAGIDLTQLSEADIWVSADGRAVQVVLPAPVIFEDNVSVDFERSRVLAQQDTCPNLLCEDDLSAYQQQVLPAAETMLIEGGQENGILNQAARDARIYYENLLRSLGFDAVRVIITGYDG